MALNLVITNTKWPQHVQYLTGLYSVTPPPLNVLPKYFFPFEPFQPHPLSVIVDLSFSMLQLSCSVNCA